MERADIIYLIKETPAARGAFDAKTETKRLVYCTIKSVTRTEAYQAMSIGHTPTYVFVLADYLEYEDERLCEYNGNRFRILRTYITAHNAIELTAEVTVE